MYNIVITDNALNNINFLKIYIWNYSEFVIMKILYTISNLTYFPNLWKSRDDWLREIIEWKYWFRIIYEVVEKENMIYIIAIFKNKSDWQAI